MLLYNASTALDLLHGRLLDASRLDLYLGNGSETYMRPTLLLQLHRTVLKRPLVTCCRVRCFNPYRSPSHPPLCTDFSILRYVKKRWFYQGNLATKLKMAPYNIVVFAGDHCGPEVTAEAVKVSWIPMERYSKLIFSRFLERLRKASQKPAFISKKNFSAE